MEFEVHLAEAIRAEAKKLADRFHAYHNGVHTEYARAKKRLLKPPTKKILVPSYWAHDKCFDPFHVLRRYKQIARSIAKKIVSGEYVPREPHTQKIPKAAGGERTVAIYQIPDAAVSKVFFDRLLAKNRHRFSSFAYAYRNDRNVHFAVQDISLDFSQSARVFVAEFDFSDFFGSISHEYLREQLDQNGFFIGQEERCVIDAFLRGRAAGIPQGTSISLFLANLVCWALDRDLQREGLQFARYADDTVIWSADYQKICNAFAIISRFSSATGIPINASKSEGIHLLTKPDMPGELAKSKTSLNFLGYSISVDHVAIKERSVLKIKKQISYLLYRNLVQPLKGPKLVGLQIPSNGQDPALLVAINQIRSYMYGGLTNQRIRDYINGRSRRIFFKGIMSFYPLVNDTDQLRSLDGWLVSAVHRCLKKRSKLLTAWHYNRSADFPFSVRREELVKSFRLVKINKLSLLEVPSFMLLYLALRKGLQENGIEYVMNSDAGDYDY